MKKKNEPSDAQKVALEIIRKASASLIRLRRTRTAFPSAREVELYAFPLLTEKEENRINASMEHLIAESGMKVEEFGVGITIPMGKGASHPESLVNIILANE